MPHAQGPHPGVARPEGVGPGRFDNQRFEAAHVTVRREVDVSQEEAYAKLLEMWPFAEAVLPSTILYYLSDERGHVVLRAFACAGPNVVPNVLSLGRALRAFRSRVVGGKQLRLVHDKAGVMRWQVVSV